ncbi:MAG: hypothetical protein ABI167_00700 [Nitrosospira sp.]
MLSAYAAALTEAEKKEQKAALMAKASRLAFEEALGVRAPPSLPEWPAFVARFKSVERWSHEGILRAVTQVKCTKAKWPVMSIGALVEDLENGWSPQCLDHPARPEHWGVLKVGAVSFGYFNETENKELPAKLKPRVYYEVKPGDVIISRANVARYVGACAYVEKTQPLLMLCDKLFRVKFREDGRLDRRFLAAVMKLPTVREQIETRLTGTSPTMKNISKSALLSLEFPVPDPDTQRALVKTLAEAEKTVTDIKTTARGYRQSAWTTFEAALFEPQV